MRFLCFFVLVLSSAFATSVELDAWKLLTSDTSVWDCLSELSEECVTKLAPKPIKQLFETQELQISENLFIEKISNGTEQRNIFGDRNWNEMLQIAVEYMLSHALKLKIGSLEARLMPLATDPANVELSLEARERSTGKSQRLYRVIIPLVVGFKITGLVIFGIVSVKMFLIKASLVANTALLVAGGVVLKKLYDHGMGMLNHHHTLLNTHMPLPNYYANNHDFSGFGYNSYSNLAANSFESSNGITGEVSDPLNNDVADTDVGGGFSNHAIAIAALNKTLLQQQQQQSLLPKRRWSNRPGKWSPWYN